MKAIKAKKIYTLGSQSIEHATMLLDKGKIVEIGNRVSLAQTCEIVDLSDSVIVPGFIDPHTHLGVWGDSGGRACFDGNEWSDPISGQVHIMDSINPRHIGFQSALAGGVTTVQILPGSSNIIGGVCCIGKTYGHTIEEMIIEKYSGLKGAMGENVKNWQRRSGPKRSLDIISRMGVAAAMRKYFNDVRQYEKKKKKEKIAIDLNLESGLRVLSKEMPLRIHAHRHDDIVTAIRLCEQYNLNYSIEHCTDGHLIRDFLGSRGATVNLGPGLISSSKVESANYTDENPKILTDAGAHVSLISDHPFLNIRFLYHYAAVVHKNGLGFDETIKSITLNAAKTLNIDHRTGSLEKGKDGDFVVLHGEPFTLNGRIEKTYILGECVWEREQKTEVL